MKKVLLIHVCLILYAELFAQRVHPKINLGEGRITILEYYIPPPPERPPAKALEPEAIVTQPPILSFTYYIKRSKILLKAQDIREDTTTTFKDKIGTKSASGVSTFLQVQYRHPAYLIDCVKETVSYIADSSGQRVEESLKGATAERFYRNINEPLLNRAAIASISDSNESQIAGKKCFRGLARDYDGKMFPFYYSKVPIGIRSPLNNFFAPDFPYTILRFDFPVQWTFPSGTVSQDGLMIVQVSEILAISVLDSMMVPPKNDVPIH